MNRRKVSPVVIAASVALATVVVVACGSSKRDGFAGNTVVNGTFDDGGNFEGGEGGPGKAVRDPSTCEESLAVASPRRRPAERSRSH